MNRWQRSLFLTVFFALGMAPGALAEGEPITDIPSLNEIEQSLTTAESLLVQQPAPATAPAPEIVQVTGVKVNPTDQGMEVILQTTLGEQLQVINRSAGNSYIADIPNAQLRLPNGEAFIFRSQKPITGITEVTVTNADANTIRVMVTDEAGVPTVELFDSPEEGLIFGVVSVADSTPPQQQPQTQPTLQPFEPGSETQSNEPALLGEEEIEIVVTGEQETAGYSVPNTSTATRTDTPIRDIPQSIQVVPRQVLEDRNVRTVTEAVETVSGVVDAGNHYGSSSGSRTIRGFRQDGNFRNGYRDAPNVYILGIPVETIEQVEVLKGPASVLFGGLEPGGIVNVITKQPLSKPYYNLAFEAGNYGLYQPSIDLSGPLTTNENLLYRFIVNYQSADSFQDFVNTNQTTVAPSITWKIGDRTNLNLYYEYTQFIAYPPVSNSLLFSDGSLTPRNLYISYPDLADNDISVQRFGYTLTSQLSDNWQIRNSFAGLDADTKETQVTAFGIEDDRFADIDAYDLDYGYKNYFAQLDLLGKLRTGAISHQLLLGFDFNDFTDSYQGLFDTNLPLLDTRNPNYDIPEPNYEPFLKFRNQVQSYGLYLQDQIAFSNNIKLLIGGRYDWVSSEFEIGDFGSLGNTTEEPTRSSGAFSPRIGLVYQPSDTISLYTSYSRSFRAETGFSSSTQGFDPTRGTQYEVGIKADWLDGRLSTTLAAYHLTKTNVVTSAPNPQFSIQTGEQRSRGIELDIAGEILPSWNLTASYAYTDAVVTEDNDFPVGNRLENAPENQVSLWTTYKIQEGDLRGLGFGLGLFYVGERQGDLANSFQLEDYLRTDAALYYRRDRFQAAINIRNLFDIDFVTFREGGRTYLRRGAPFTIIGSISWKF